MIAKRFETCTDDRVKVKKLIEQYKTLTFETAKPLVEHMTIQRDNEYKPSPSICGDTKYIPVLAWNLLYATKQYLINEEKVKEQEDKLTRIGLEREEQEKKIKQGEDDKSRLRSQDKIIADLKMKLFKELQKSSFDLEEIGKKLMELKRMDCFVVYFDILLNKHDSLRKREHRLKKYEGLSKNTINRRIKILKNKGLVSGQGLVAVKNPTLVGHAIR